MPLLRKIAAHLPVQWQIEIKRIYYRRQIKKSTFKTDEPEYEMLHNLISPGDWIIDVGANIGHYTKRFSDLVGAQGRVIAFEPVPTTFSILSANVQLFTYPNVTLINAAVSDKMDLVYMSVPKFSDGLNNYYRAQISSSSDSNLAVIVLSLDSFLINQSVSLVKIDAEGHEFSVLQGMQKLIKDHRPILIIETDSKEVIANLTSLGYVVEKLKGSPNILFKPTIKKSNF